MEEYVQGIVNSMLHTQTKIQRPWLSIHLIEACGLLMRLVPHTRDRGSPTGIARCSGPRSMLGPTINSSMSMIDDAVSPNNIIHLQRISRVNSPVSVPRISEELSSKWLVAVRE